MFDKVINTPIVRIDDESIEPYGVELYIKREDLTDPWISGNKYRKLKYNLINARGKGFHTLLTFGGAYSNHIHTVAYAGKKYDFKTIGIIRGEENLPLNPTLEEATANGMDLHYISRPDYRNKTSPEFIENLRKQFGEFYLLPEGGANKLAVRGCTEIIDLEENIFDHVCCSCGNGTTLAGIISSLKGKKKVWGYPALKNGSFLKKDIAQLLMDFEHIIYDNWDLITTYHFGGYAKYDYDLISFINKFKKVHGIQLDPIYTGKLLFGIYDQIKAGNFRSGEKVLAIHTGGLQGIHGFNRQFGGLLI